MEALLIAEELLAVPDVIRRRVLEPAQTSSLLCQRRQGGATVCANEGAPGGCSASGYHPEGGGGSSRTLIGAAAGCLPFDANTFGPLGGWPSLAILSCGGVAPQAAHAAELAWRNAGPPPERTGEMSRVRVAELEGGFRHAVLAALDQTDRALAADFVE